MRTCMGSADWSWSIKFFRYEVTNTLPENIPALVAKYEKNYKNIEKSLVNLSVHSGVSYHDLKWMTTDQRKMLRDEIQNKFDKQSGKQSTSYL